MMKVRRGKKEKSGYIQSAAWRPADVPPQSHVIISNNVTVWVVGQFFFFPHGNQQLFFFLFE